jgi:hypothetical protein
MAFAMDNPIAGAMMHRHDAKVKARSRAANGPGCLNFGRLQACLCAARQLNDARLRVVARRARP